MNPLPPTALLVPFLLLATPAAAQQPPEPNQFAYGADIAGVDGNGLQTVLLPRHVYQRVVRDDLGDLRVFNGEQQEVPHALRTLDDQSEEPLAPVPLRLFPLRSRGGLDPADLSLTVKADNNGVLMSVHAEAGAAGSKADEQAIVAYIADASHLDRSIDSLLVTWQGAGEGFLARLDLEGSDDLEFWYSMADRAVVAELAYQGEKLARRRISFPRRQYKYLRLRASDDQPLSFEITELHAEVAPLIRGPELEYDRLTAQEVEGEPGLFRFDLGGPFRVNRWQIELPQLNSLVQVELSSSKSADGPWTQRFSGNLYRITKDEEELSSPERPIAVTADRYWQLRVDPKGGGLGSGLPTLRVAWLPQQLLFLSRGAQPFLLAYGSQRVQPGSFSPQSLMEMLPEVDTAQLDRPSCFLDQEKPLAGDIALLPPPPEMPWKKYVLWGVLIAGVLLLVWMAIGLVRQLGAGESTPPPAGNQGHE